MSMTAHRPGSRKMPLLVGISIAVLALFGPTLLTGAWAGDGSLPARHDLEFWRSVASGTPPSSLGIPAAELAPELTRMLASDNPELRDGLAATILTEWIGAPAILDGTAVAHLSLQLRSMAASGLGERPSDATFGRSFALLSLAAVVRRDTADPVLDDQELQAILETAIRSAQTENDLRGWVEGKGWCHAGAHTADLLRALAQDPRIGGAGQRRILRAIASLATRHHGWILAFGEDGRLAAAAIAVLQRGSLSERDWSGWLDQLTVPFRDGAAAASVTQLDLPGFAAERNARNLLFSVYVQLDSAREEIPLRTALMTRLRATIAGN